jgi:hypothetical protein
MYVQVYYLHTVGPYRRAECTCCAEMRKSKREIKRDNVDILAIRADGGWPE